MPEWLVMLVKFGTTELPKLLKKNVYRTVALTAISTLTVQWIVLGPFGSDLMRNVFISTILTRSSDVGEFVGYYRENENLRHLLKGAASQGFFDKDDPQVVDDWKRLVESPAYTDVAGETGPTAIQAAREKAASLESPFQPIGRRLAASAPDCMADRPDPNRVIINPRNVLLRDLSVGSQVRIQSATGGGRPVYAVIDLPRGRTMPDDVDLYLNKIQYFDMLLRTEPISQIVLSKTNSNPNQQAIDAGRYPEPNKCSIGG